jgi:hypothetical protein
LGRLPRRLLAVTAAGRVASFALTLGVGFALAAMQLVRSPVLVTVVLSATSLGIVLLVLADAGEAESDFGRLIVAGASVAELAPIVLLSLLFSESQHDVGSRAALLALFVAIALAAVLTVLGIERWRRLRRTLQELQETTSQFRVRAAFALRRVDGDDPGRPRPGVQPSHRGQGAAVPQRNDRGQGSSGLDPSAVAQHRAHVIAAGLLHATSLGIPAVAGLLRVRRGLLPPETYAALVAAGLVSAVVFPAVSLRMLRPREP